MTDFDMNFSESVYDIEAAVEKCGFPVVVKSENECPEKTQNNYFDEEFYQNSQKLPHGSITMLERKITLEFVHVTVMEYRDQNKVMAEKGDGYVEHHLELEDDDYLLPLTFDGKCKIIHPPGKRKRYVAVSQLIKDLPRWIRVNDQLVAISSNSEDVHVIHAGEIWEISGIKKIETTKCLVCKYSENQSVIIREDIPINISAISPFLHYSLVPSLKNSVLEIQVNAVVVKDFILGWCIPVEVGGTKRLPRTVLIPKNKWKYQKVKIRSFKNRSERMQYRKKHFPSPTDSDYLEHKLYLMDAGDYPGIIWLQDRQPASERPKPAYNPRDSRSTTVHRPPPIPIVTEELPQSDIGVDDYEEPIPKQEPALPPRKALSTEKIEKPDSWKAILETIQRKSRSGFDKVHTEIKNLFRNKSNVPPSLYPRPSVKHGNISKEYQSDNGEDDKLSTTGNKSHSKFKLPKSLPLDSSLEQSESESNVPPPVYPRSTAKHGNLSEGCQSNQADEDKPSTTRDKNKANSQSKPPKSLPSDSSTKQSETNGDVHSKSNASDTEKVQESPDLYFTPTGENGDEIDVYYEGQVLREQENKDKNDAFVPSPISRRPQLPLPPPPRALGSHEGLGAIDSDDDYDYPDETEILKLKRTYGGIDVVEVDRVSRDGQTAESFYDYSIDEVVRCFKMVGLPGMATKCEREKFDGKFFKDLEKEDIKVLFELERLHLLKVKKAIFDGWRPK